MAALLGDPSAPLGLIVRWHIDQIENHRERRTILLKPLLLFADLLQFHRIFGDSGPYLFFNVDPKLRRIRFWKPSIAQIMLVTCSQRNDQFMYQIRVFFKNGNKETLVVSADVLEQIERSGIEISKGPRFNR